MDQSPHHTPTSGHGTMEGKEGASFVTPDGSVDAKFQSDVLKEPSENDVLCGRGGSINSHPGNERFRTLVEKRKRVYLTARFKREKRLIASSIVSEIRALNPPGRFLSRDTKSGLWRDIGDEKARDKTSQALRENAPTIRAEIETEINEQRVEMQRAEEEEAAAARASATQHPQSSYYNQAWGGYHSYYGYSHHAPPPPHAHPPHPPPPPPHPHGPPHPGYHPGPYDGQWGAPPPHHPPYPPYGPPPPQYAHPPPPSQPKSAFEQTADFVASGAESIKSLTKASVSFGAAQSTSSNDAQDTRSTGYDSRSIGSASQGSKPIVYVHKDENKKRRIVKFRPDSRHNRRRMVRNQGYSNGASSLVNGSNSLLEATLSQEEEDHDEHDLEPQRLDAAGDDPNSSLMTQVANQILGSIGSWDTANIVCGQDSVDDRVPFPGSHNPSGSASSRRPVRNRGSEDAHQDPDDMAVEWEGQEVQLLGDPDFDSVASEDRMPPPVVRQRPVPDQASSIGFSSLGSCHSWLPDHFGSAASFFSGGNKNTGVSPANSMEMEYSAAGTENFSTNGSLGGASLTKVFETDELPPHQQMTSSSMGQRVLNQVPSWERSVRSKSPLSIASDDDESLVSKTSSKLSEGVPGNFSPITTPMDHDMWGKKE